ncbi:MAG: Glycosyl transferase, group 1 [Candidatus Wolfebacteria bacterium GW2011_GWC2_46_275]|uniref:Glycosyl transferase, group 1 n=2 Tax=Candidatus Wolfeibacteriota TaxID=1752735 RepID=A0A0G1U752_9BACT|nr:MAG: FkbM family methyltransferase [Candidatus Wolfebacteria bacterium GW2011_GWB1_47_1]KKU36902.1 MAG: Glycosyl transferase, group 1 [Candidatus Wolfebacteria bacterium GW2011_GWC2_46_275]KKU41602.1 MAG: Glycosyl transferase, group 1 [Candidatus Wolfebacteria bacterium GW2011_GWB2_46_69]KKU53771.1 MAG: Glycosyl transferase, group 1 [Candidatus Wolfebacteria bacterium GW2011_GWC1_47_103]KKU59890.1 MAG: Glycosyl transferase, group 1 [Candidatus Wolfebacteria bacterium GW2011_GWE2_47_12]KKU65
MTKLKYYLGRIMVRIMGLHKKPSYSSLNEDVIIDWLTGHKERGTYIDIGANHPDRINNTKLFYERGWRGINIEPDPTGYALFVEKRPEDVNLNCAIGEGEIDYFEGGDDTSGNTCVRELAELRGMKSHKRLTLKPLREVFQEHDLHLVDFISIDVETFENEVLRSNDWNKYKARVICLEGDNYSLLKRFGYRKVFWDGNNSYYKLKGL